MGWSTGAHGILGYVDAGGQGPASRATRRTAVFTIVRSAVGNLNSFCCMQFQPAGELVEQLVGLRWMLSATGQREELVGGAPGGRLAVEWWLAGGGGHQCGVMALANDRGGNRLGGTRYAAAASSVGPSLLSRAEPLTTSCVRSLVSKAHRGLV